MSVNRSVEHPSLTQVALQVNKSISLTKMNQVIPKVGAKNELSFIKPASGTFLSVAIIISESRNSSSRIALTIGSVYTGVCGAISVSHKLLLKSQLQQYYV